MVRAQPRRRERRPSEWRRFLRSGLGGCDKNRLARLDCGIQDSLLAVEILTRDRPDLGHANLARSKSTGRTGHVGVLAEQRVRWAGLLRHAGRDQSRIAAATNGAGAIRY